MEIVEQVKSDFMWYDYTVSNETFYSSHHHDAYEIFYFLNGDRVLRRLEDQEYLLKPHSLLLVPGGTFHSWKVHSRQPYHRLSIHFLPEFFNESERSFFFPIFKNKKERYVNNASGLIETFALSLLECRDMEKPVQKMAIKSRIVSLLTQVYKQHREEEGAAKYVIRDGRIKAVLEYISENLSKPMDMDTLSRFFAISKDYLNILFKKETNNTVTQYIRNQRLNFARREILAGKGAEETAFAVGFNDYSSFFRAYKARFGTAPTVQLDMTATLEAP